MFWLHRSTQNHARDVTTQARPLLMLALRQTVSTWGNYKKKGIPRVVRHHQKKKNEMHRVEPHSHTHTHTHTHTHSHNITCDEEEEKEEEEEVKASTQRPQMKTRASTRRRRQLVRV